MHVGKFYAISELAEEIITFINVINNYLKYLEDRTEDNKPADLARLQLSKIVIVFKVFILIIQFLKRFMLKTLLETWLVKPA